MYPMANCSVINFLFPCRCQFESRLQTALKSDESVSNSSSLLTFIGRFSIYNIPSRSPCRSRIPVVRDKNITKVLVNVSVYLCKTID